ncbi:hypothetical protein [Massilia sp. DD77]|uniref:hypothetical protein n=1 Tax=Massilia sp. DD77 TaxID=3109349 RepID=UPI00300052E8
MSTAMRELNVSEINDVAGAIMTETKCIAIVTLAGGLFGAGIGAWGTAGFGAGAGFSGGVRLGAIAGGLVCGSIYE